MLASFQGVYYPHREVSPEEAMQRLMQAAGPGAGQGGPCHDSSDGPAGFSDHGNLPIWTDSCSPPTTLPETNIQVAPENRPGPKRKGLYSSHTFSGANC